MLAVMHANKISMIPYDGYRWVRYPEGAKENLTYETANKRWKEVGEYVRTSEKFAKQFYPDGWEAYGKMRFEDSVNYWVECFGYIQPKKNRDKYMTYAMNRPWVVKRIKLYGRPYRWFFPLLALYRRKYRMWRICKVFYKIYPLVCGWYKKICHTVTFGHSIDEVETPN